MTGDLRRQHLPGVRQFAGGVGPRARVRSSHSRTGCASASRRSPTVSGGTGSATGYCTTGCRPGT